MDGFDRVRLHIGERHQLARFEIDDLAVDRNPDFAVEDVDGRSAGMGVLRQGAARTQSDQPRLKKNVLPEVQRVVTGPQVVLVVTQRLDGNGEVEHLEAVLVEALPWVASDDRRFDSHRSSFQGRNTRITGRLTHQRQLSGAKTTTQAT